MADIQTFDVAEAIVTTLRAATGFKAPTESGTDVPVFDGPPVTQAQLLRFVAIGWDGDRDNVAGGFEGDWSGFGAGSAREETGRVVCFLIVGAGDADFTDLRTTAKGIMGDVSDAIRATPALGLSPVVQWAHVTAGQWSQGVTAKGGFVKVTFTVEYLARI